MNWYKRSQADDYFGEDEEDFVQEALLDVSWGNFRSSLFNLMVNKVEERRVVADDKIRNMISQYIDDSFDRYDFNRAQPSTITYWINCKIDFITKGRKKTLKAAKSPRFELDTFENQEPAVAGPDEDSGSLAWLLGIPGANSAYTGDEKEVSSGSTHIIEYRGEFGSIRYLWLEDGQTIGGIQLVTSGRDSVLSNVYVDPNYRRQGIASRLIEHAKKKHPRLQISPYFSPAGAGLMGFDN